MAAGPWSSLGALWRTPLRCLWAATRSPLRPAEECRALRGRRPLSECPLGPLGPLGGRAPPRALTGAASGGGRAGGGGSSLRAQC